MSPIVPLRLNGHGRAGLIGVQSPLNLRGKRHQPDFNSFNVHRVRLGAPVRAAASIASAQASVRSSPTRGRIVRRQLLRADQRR